jgi:tetratricopeptide (TPR) repeat protein
MSRSGRSVWIALALVCLFAQPARAEPLPSHAELEQLAAGVAADPDDGAARSRYGDALFRSGDAMESLKVLNPGRRPDAKWVPELRQAATVYLDLEQHDAARRALEQAIELEPNDATLYEELAQVYAAARGEGQLLEGDPLGDDATASAPVPPGETPLNEAPTDPKRLMARVAVLAGIALLAAGSLLLLRRLRVGRGDLIVSMELPPDRSGAFSVRLATERSRLRSRTTEAAAELETRASSRFEHFLVARETQFRGIPARSYWVSVEGALTRGEDEPGEPIREEREARVEKDRSVRLVVDLRPRLAAIEVSIVREERPVREGRVAIGGDPTSLRLAKLGRLRLDLPQGAYRLLASRSSS